MKKKKIILILLIIIIVLAFPIKRVFDKGETVTYSSLLYKIIVWDKDTSNEITDIHWFPNNFHQINYYVIVDDDYLSMYEQIIDSIYSTSTILNKDAKYIALDLDSFKYLEEEDKEKLLKYTEKYCPKVINSTYETISKKESIPVSGEISGILISAEDVIRENKVITLRMTKYKANVGSVISIYKAIYEKSEWNVVITSFELS